MDNGKIRMQQYNKAMIIEGYTSDVVTSKDIDWVIETLHICYPPPFLVILVKSGNYSLSVDAQNRLMDERNGISKVAYVSKKMQNTRYAIKASKTYLIDREVFICDSIDSAYRALTGGLQSAQSNSA